MEYNAFKLLESTTIRTLHAHSFTRSSTQASLVLTDLLARYLSLLTSTCAQYAQHAGRTNLTARDVLFALDEMGVNVEELEGYMSVEGMELGRYATRTARKTEELNELKAAMREGLPPSHEAIPLQYAPLLYNLLDEDEDENHDQAEDQAEDEDTASDGNTMALEQPVKVMRQNEVGLLDGLPPLRRAPSAHPLPPSTPPLPLSPISNPSSPARKRPRTESWQPPEHIPSFLPPFPSTSSVTPQPEPMSIPHSSLRNHGADRPPSPPRHSSTAPADYATAVPYADSSLAGTPEWHLPTTIHPPSSASSGSFHQYLSTPQVPPSLIAAYHHILTHPPPANPNAANPSRHRVAMALLEQTQRKPRWEPADTLYANLTPNLPTVAPFGPSYPVPVNPTPPASDKKDEDGKDKDKKMPPVPPWCIVPFARESPLVSSQGSRIPELARDTLSGPVFSRITRLGHPPVLSRGSDKLTYGPGVPAYWNKTAVPMLPAGVSAGPTPITNLPNGLSNGKGKEKAKESDKDKDKAASTDGLEKESGLQDARFYATWEYEPKSFRAELVPPRRAKQGAFQSNVFGVGVKRSTNESHGRGG